MLDTIRTRRPDGGVIEENSSQVKDKRREGDFVDCLLIYSFSNLKDYF